MAVYLWLVLYLCDHSRSTLEHVKVMWTAMLRAGLEHVLLDMCTKYTIMLLLKIPCRQRRQKNTPNNQFCYLWFGYEKYLTTKQTKLKLLKNPVQNFWISKNFPCQKCDCYTPDAFLHRWALTFPSMWPLHSRVELRFKVRADNFPLQQMKVRTGFRCQTLHMHRSAQRRSHSQVKQQ